MQGDELRHDRSSVAVLTARELRGETTYQPYLDKDRKKPSVQGPKKNTCTWKVEHRVVSALLRFIASWQGIKKDVKPLTTTKANKEISHQPYPLQPRWVSHGAECSCRPPYPLQPLNPAMPSRYLTPIPEQPPSRSCSRTVVVAGLCSKSPPPPPPDCSLLVNPLSLDLNLEAPLKISTQGIGSIEPAKSL